MVHQLGRSRPEEIIKKACEFFKISHEQLASKSRKQPLCSARQMLQTFLYLHTNLSLKQVGALFGDRDHTTVLHARQVVQDDCDTNEEYNFYYKQFKNHMNAS